MPRYILSEKKKNLLVDDENYTYRRERDDAKKTKTYWKCVKSDKSACTARITSLFGEPTIVKFVNQHSHTTTTFEVGCKEYTTSLVVDASNSLNCISEKYPNASIFCCLFHFCQAHYRKLVDLGFKVQYGTDAGKDIFKQVSP